MTPASFINLDLELSSAVDLTDLATHWSKQAFILFHGETGTEYKLVAELIDSAMGEDALACTERFLRLISALPPALLGLWHQCSSRVFDYGFDGGLEDPPLQTTLSSAVLLRMAELGIDLRITVYPFRDVASE